MQKQSETIRSYTRVPGNVWPLWSIPATGALSAQQGFPACEVPAHPECASNHKAKVSSLKSEASTVQTEQRRAEVPGAKATLPPAPPPASR